MRAYFLIMHSYNNAYTNSAALAGLREGKETGVHDTWIEGGLPRWEVQLI